MKTLSKTVSRKSKRSGAAIVIVVVSIFIFLIMAAFSVDIAHFQLAKTEMRASVDAASKAGAEALVREDSLSVAIKAAKDNSEINTISGKPLSLIDAEIEVGRSMRNRDGTWNFSPGEKPFSAVRVTVDRPVSLFFGGITGTDLFDSSASATAAFADNEICLVVDRSHSMCFDLLGPDWSYPPNTPTDPDPVAYPPDPSLSRWSVLEDAIDEFFLVLAKRTSANRVALATFGSEITLQHYEGALTGRTFPAVAEDVQLTTNHSLITTAITNRGDDIMLGGTNLTGGIDAGVRMLTGSNSDSTAVKTMIVMTDGKWNHGGNPQSAAQAAKKAGITVHTVTFLDKADQTSMIEVAEVGGGNHYHASDRQALVEAFRDLANNIPVTMIE